MNDKKQNNRSKFWFFLILTGLIFKILGPFLRKNGSKTSFFAKNLSSFFKDEKREYSHYKSKNESFGKYCTGTASIFSYYFIPGKHNGHKPKILRTQSLALIILVLFVIKISITGYLFFLYPNQARMEEQIINDVLRLTNEDRLNGNLQPLAMNSSLSFAAQAKAEDMLKNNYFAHYSPDGKKPWDWIDRSGYAYLFVGENLAMNFSSAVSAHTALMNSPTHRKNIMSEKYRDVGLAIVSGEIEGRKTNILVELFASRQPTNIAIAPAPDHTAGTSQEKIITNDTVVKEETKVLSTAVKPVVAVTPAPTPTVKKTEPIAPAPPVASPPVESAVRPNPIEEATTTAKTINVDDFEKLPEQEPDTSIAATGSTTVAAIENYQDLPVNQELNNNLEFYSTTEDVELSFAEKLIKWSKYIYFAFALILIAALFMNIIIKIKIQHKPVIVQTVFTILLIIGLMSVKVHALETIARVIAII